MGGLPWKTGIRTCHRNFPDRTKRKASNLASQLVFREACAADKSEVLSMRRNVYRGLDYLPDYYDFFIRDTNRRCIVGQLNSKIVSFGVMLSLDRGQSVLGQAGRVHEEYVGRGFFSALSKHINQRAIDNGCKRRVALVETTLNKYARSEKFRKTHVEVGSKLHYAGIITDKMRTALKASNEDMAQLSHVISSIDSNQLLHYIRLDDIRHVLFPKGRSLLDYVPYRVIPENIPLMYGRNTRFFSNVRGSGSDITGLLSAGTFYKCENPKESYTVDIFGSDVKSLEKHVLFHVGRAVNLTSGPFCLQLFVEKGYVAQKLCEVLIRHDVPKHNWYVEGGVATKSIVEEPFAWF